MLKRLKLIKRCLQAMAISEQWASYREDDVGKAQKVKDMILSDLCGIKLIISLNSQHLIIICYE